MGRYYELPVALADQVKAECRRRGVKQSWAVTVLLECLVAGVIDLDQVATAASWDEARRARNVREIMRGQRKAAAR